MIAFRDARPEDFGRIVPVLRPADCEEWLLASGKTPAQHLRDGSWSIPEGPGCLTRVAEDAEGPLLLYGVNRSPLPAWGWVWLIACNRAPQHVVEFHRHWDAEVQRLFLKYDKLYTASWMGNRAHHKWLRWVGFKPLGPAVPLNGATFQPFIYGD